MQYLGNGEFDISGKTLNLLTMEFDGKSLADISDKYIDNEILNFSKYKIQYISYPTGTQEFKEFGLEIHSCAHCSTKKEDMFLIDGVPYCAKCILELRICEDCGALLIEDIHEFEGSYYCENCFHNTFSYCDNCGKIIYTDDSYYIADAIYCEHCRDRLFYQCDDCGEYFDSDDVYQDSNSVYCHRCFERSYYFCDTCSCIVHCDNVCTNDYGTYCESCFEDVENSASIHAYNYTPNLLFHGTGPYFGIELEIDKGNREEFIEEFIEEFSSDTFYLKNDGSLSDNGVEIVSHPHGYDEILAIDWQALSRLALKHEFRSHDTDTCGLHIHISRKNLADRQIGRIIYIYEKLYADMLKFSRRREENLSRWAGRYDPPLDCSYTAIYDYAKNQNTRYRAINIKNSQTIEFRFFRGTLKPDTIKASIQLVNNLYHIAISEVNLTTLVFSDIVNIGNQAEFFKYVSDRNI